MRINRLHRRGNLSMIMGVSIMSLLLIGAVVIDVAWARVARIQTQQAADAGAHAGASQLDGTNAGMAEANSLADVVVAAHSLAGEELSATTRTAGVWDAESRSFTESSDLSEINAYKVRASRPGLGTFLGGVTGLTSVNIQSEATAIVNHRGAGGVACYLPLAVPQCVVNLAGGKVGLDNYNLTLGNATSDTVGWALINSGVNATTLNRQINSGGCADGEIEVDDPVNLNNGQITSVLTNLVTAIGNSSTWWDASVWGALPARQGNSSISVANYGRVIEGAIIVFDDGNSGCDGNAQFNQSKPIVAFVWAALYDVVNSGGAANRTVRLRLDTSNRVYGTRPGGTDLGITVPGAGLLVE